GRAARGAHGERRGDRYHHTLHPGFDHGPAEPASRSRASSAQCDAIVGPVLGRQNSTSPSRYPNHGCGGDRMIPRVPLREALSDTNLLGTAIAGDSWCSWRILLIAAMGEALREDEREVFSQLTGREHEPLQRATSSSPCSGEEVASPGQWRRLPPTLLVYATTAMRWCLVNAASCSAWRSISGWRRSFSTTPRPASNAVRS